MKNSTTKRQARLRPVINATIVEVDFNQRVTIKFARQMFVPKNVRIFEKAKALQFSVLEAGSVNRQLNVVKSWRVESFKEDSLVIKMEIDDPSILSVTKVSVDYINIIGL
jgi:hypothetical protein